MSEEPFDLSDPKMRAAVGQVMRDLAGYMDAMDARDTHCLLVTDPDTGARHVTGPFPDRLHARIAAILLEARSVAADPDLGNLVYEPVLWIDNDLPMPSREALEAARREAP